MLPAALTWLTDELDALESASLRRRLAVRESSQQAHLVIDGERLVNFGANDYLGLAADPRLGEAARAAADCQGWGSGASPLVSGRSAEHALLEQELARFEATEAALLFASGFAANAGTIPALVGEGDAIYSDSSNHASLIDGCRLARAAKFVYPHGDAGALAKLLRETGEYRRRLVVTDSLFSMDGDFAPLVEIGRLAAEHQAMLLVDDAHGTGVWGNTGRGVVEHLAAAAPKLEEQVTIRVGTLSKALGSSGGFVAGPQMLIDWLANRARSYVFSTAPPAAMAAAARRALVITREEPHRRIEVLARADDLRYRLSTAGWNVGNSESQIVPIIVGEADRAIALAAKVREAGLFVPCIRPPTVAPGESRLRVSLSYLHGEEDIERLASALGKPAK